MLVLPGCSLPKWRVLIHNPDITRRMTQAFNRSNNIQCQCWSPSLRSSWTDYLKIVSEMAAIDSKTSLSVARNSVLFSMRKWATRLIIIYLFPAHNQIAYTLLQLTPTSLHQQFNWSHRPRSILSEFKSVHVMSLIQWENSTSPLRQILRHLIRRQAWDVIVTSGVGFHEKAMQQTTEVTEWKQIRLSTSSSGHRKAHVHLPTTATFSC